MLHASALAVGWRSALAALFTQRRGAVAPPDVSSTDIPRQIESDDEREPFYLDDTEIALRLVKSRGLLEYKTPPHAHLLFPQLPAR